MKRPSFHRRSFDRPVRRATTAAATVAPHVTADDDTWGDDRPDRSRQVRTGLVGTLLLTCVFLGGVQVQKQWGESASTSGLPAGLPAGLADSLASGSLPAGLPGLPGGSTGSTSAASDQPAVIGKITTAGGRAITVTDISGTQHTVTLDDDTTIARSITLTADQIRTGDSVTVTGTTDRGGRIAATALTLR